MVIPADEKEEVNRNGGGEPQYFVPGAQVRPSHDSGQPPAWAPARLARQLYEESSVAGQGAERPQNAAQLQGTVNITPLYREAGVGTS